MHGLTDGLSRTVCQILEVKVFLRITISVIQTSLLPLDSSGKNQAIVVIWTAQIIENIGPIYLRVLYLLCDHRALRSRYGSFLFGVKIAIAPVSFPSQ